MTHDDQGPQHGAYGQHGSYGPYPQHTQHGQHTQPAQYGPHGPATAAASWTAEQHRIRRRRRTRFAVLAATGGVLVVAIAAGTLMYTGGSGDDDRAAPPATATATAAADPSVTAAPPSGAPSALPSLLARPVVRPEQAFPETNVRLSDGSRYKRVDLVTTTECAQGMSPQLAALVDQGEGCLRLTAALFTDAERRSQVSVTVASFVRAEDAGTVFAMASMDPVTYQTVSLDPPPEAGLPTVPPGSAGVFRRLMTVRSVVFANGQWGDGSEAGEAALTRQTEGLLRYVNDHVVAYEQGGV
ncbi:hypothetical protein RI578_28295 [Streptomyces sp. BB1-1-1]|uniref:hypothetical protein n=1 Tax=Streptomyces sp. BB1-1-1 TaxID=3074430 RepID=UPI002877A5A4|nr:hypothetical protein [Streptomyces sp. BB1-1-1]WND37946.1 hypothetical protein RI578_28295 [Streptomyces sp. BB1-1-1]